MQSSYSFTIPQEEYSSTQPPPPEKSRGLLFNIACAIPKGIYSSLKENLQVTTDTCTIAIAALAPPKEIEMTFFVKIDPISYLASKIADSKHHQNAKKRMQHYNEMIKSIGAFIKDSFIITSHIEINGYQLLSKTEANTIIFQDTFHDAIARMDKRVDQFHHMIKEFQAAPLDKQIEYSSHFLTDLFLPFALTKIFKKVPLYQAKIRLTHPNLIEKNPHFPLKNNFLKNPNKISVRDYSTFSFTTKPNPLLQPTTHQTKEFNFLQQAIKYKKILITAENGLRHFIQHSDHHDDNKDDIPYSIPTYEETKNENKMNEFSNFPPLLAKEEKPILTKYSIIDKNGFPGISIPLHNDLALNITGSPTTAVMGLSMRLGTLAKKNDSTTTQENSNNIEAMKIGTSLVASAGITAIGIALKAGVDYGNKKWEEHDHKKYLKHFKKDKQYTQADHAFNQDVVKRNLEAITSGEIYTDNAIQQLESDISHLRKKEKEADSRKRYARKHRIKKGDKTADFFKAERDLCREQIAKLSELKMNAELELQQRQNQKKALTNRIAFYAEKHLTIDSLLNHLDEIVNRIPTSKVNTWENLLIETEKNTLTNILKNKLFEMQIDFHDEKNVNQILEYIQRLSTACKEDNALIELQSAIKQNVKETQEKIFAFKEMQEKIAAFKETQKKIAAFQAQKDAAIQRIKEYNDTDPDKLSGLIDRHTELVKEVVNNPENLLLKEEKNSLFEIIKNKLLKLSINYNEETDVNITLKNIQQLLLAYKEDTLLIELQSTIQKNLKKTIEFKTVNKTIASHLLENEYKKAFNCAIHYADKNPFFVESPIYLQSTWEYYIDRINHLDFNAAIKIGEDYRIHTKEKEIDFLKDKESNKIQKHIEKMEKQLATNDFVANHEIKYQHIALHHGTKLIINTLVDYLTKHSNGRKKQLLKLTTEMHKLSSLIFPTLIQFALKYYYPHHKTDLLLKQFIEHFTELNVRNGWLPFVNINASIASGITSSQILPNILKWTLPDKKDTIKKFFTYAAFTAQLTQMVTSNVIHLQKLYHSRFTEFTHKTVTPLTTLSSNVLFFIFEKWYHKKYRKIPESSTYYWMKDNAIELLTLISFLAHSLKTPEKSRDYAWRYSRANLAWQTISKSITALYKISNGSYADSANKALLQNVLNSHKNYNPHPQGELRDLSNAFSLLQKHKLISKEVREAFKIKKVAEYAEDAAIIFKNLHFCGYFCNTLLTPKNISAIELRAEDIPILRKAIESLNINRMLTQPTLEQLFQNSHNADLMATQIISTKRTSLFSHYSFIKQTKNENRDNIADDYSSSMYKYSN